MGNTDRWTDRVTLNTNFVGDRYNFCTYKTEPTIIEHTQICERSKSESGNFLKALSIL